MRNFIHQRKDNGQYDGYMWRRNYPDGTKIMALMKIIARLFYFVSEAYKLCRRIDFIVQLFLALYNFVTKL